jgi:peptidoglycan/xylan/chitin deacetylase (PgdA/CDA1 family)
MSLVPSHNNFKLSGFFSFILRPVTLSLALSILRNRFPILVFHRVPKHVDPLRSFIDSSSFSSIMTSVASHFNVLPLHEAIERMNNHSLPARALSITFDDGYTDNIHVAFPILQRLGLHATFFISTGYLNDGWMWNDGLIESVAHAKRSILDLSALGLGVHKVASLEEKRSTIGKLITKLKYLPPEKRIGNVEHILSMASVKPPETIMMTSSQVRFLSKNGMEIGGHTVTHPVLTAVDDKTAFHEILSNKEHLEDLTGKQLRLFAYPNGKPGKDYGPHHIRMVKDSGYSAAVSTRLACVVNSSDSFELPRFTPWDRHPAKFITRLLYYCTLSRLSPG